MIDTIKTHLLDQDFELGIEIQQYSVGGGIALFLHCIENGEAVEPFANLTVNLPSYHTGGTKAFVDTNNFPQALDLIEKNNLGHWTGELAQSGFCAYPKVEFDMQEVGKYILNQSMFDKIVSQKAGVER